MSISAADNKLLQSLASGSGLQWGHIAECVKIWRRSHNMLTTFFSGRWGKPEGMPTFIQELKQLLDLNCRGWEAKKAADLNGPMSGDSATAVGVILEERIRRGSASTRNPHSISTKIASILDRILSAVKPSSSPASAEFVKTVDIGVTVLTMRSDIAIYASPHSNRHNIAESIGLIEGGGPHLLSNIAHIYLLAKTKNKLAEFYSKLDKWGCVAARSNPVLSWGLELQGVKLENFEEVIGKYVNKGRSYLTALGKDNLNNMVDYLYANVKTTRFDVEAGVEDGVGKTYCPKGYLSKASIQRYLIDALLYDDPAVAPAPTAAAVRK